MLQKFAEERVRNDRPWYIQAYVQCQLTPAVVSCLTDDQLVGLGITTIGDRTILRHKCRGFLKVFWVATIVIMYATL